MEVEGFLTAAYELYLREYDEFNQNLMHLVVENNDIAACVGGKSKKQLINVSKPQQRRCKAVLKSLMCILEISALDVLDLVLKPGFMPKDVILDAISKPNSTISQSLSSFGVAHLLDPLKTVALLRTREYTEHDFDFFRRFFNGLLPVKVLREARWSLPENLPTLYSLHFDWNAWNELSRMGFVMNLSRGRNVQCVRTSLIDAVESFTNIAKSADVWPEPPKISILQQKFHGECLILLLSIDSAKGNTKWMG